MRFFITFIATIVIAGSVSCGSANNWINESTKPADAVKGAFDKFAGAKVFNLTIKTDIGEMVGETEVAYSAPDKFWIKNRSKVTSEIIAIGNNSYQRIDGAKWNKLPPEQAFDTFEFRERLFEQSRSVVSGLDAAGSEDLGGKKSFVYRFKSNSNPDFEYKIWISAETGFPLQMVGEKETLPSGSVTTTYDFEKEAQIEAPIVE